MAKILKNGFLTIFWSNMGQISYFKNYFQVFFHEKSEFVIYFIWKRFLKKSTKIGQRFGHHLGPSGQIWHRIRNPLRNFRTMSYPKKKSREFVQNIIFLKTTKNSIMAQTFSQVCLENVTFWFAKEPMGHGLKKIFLIFLNPAVGICNWLSVSRVQIIII